MTRIAPAQIIRQAEELLEQRGLPPPEFSIDITFPRGGPGEPGPNEPRPPADYVAWCAGGPMPTTQEGLDWFVTSLKLEELI